MPKGPTGSHTGGRSGVDKLVADYLADLGLRGRTGRTVENYRSNLKHYLAFLAGKPPHRADREDLARFLAKLVKGPPQIGAKAISRYFSALNSFYAYLEYVGKVPVNPVPSFRHRFLDIIQREASKNVTALRQLISVDDLRRLAHSIADTRDRALLVLSAKTGIRRQELIDLDVEDVDWKEMSIQLKSKHKRTNRLVFFDDETARLLKTWMTLRQARGAPPTGPLFTNNRTNRLHRNGVYYAITDAAQNLGLHDPAGSLKQKFTPHCLRHWFTTHLQRQGMPREFIAWLRGDAPAATVDLYTHIDKDQVKEAYLAKIPQLGL